MTEIKSFEEKGIEVNCRKCRFIDADGGHCQLAVIFKTFGTLPICWYMRRIEEIINE